MHQNVPVAVAPQLRTSPWWLNLSERPQTGCPTPSNVLVGLEAMRTSPWQWPHALPCSCGGANPSERHRGCGPIPLNLPVVVELSRTSPWRWPHAFESPRGGGTYQNVPVLVAPRLQTSPWRWNPSEHLHDCSPTPWKLPVEVEPIRTSPQL